MESSDLTAISVIIAAIAVIISACQVYQTRKHNRLSMKPNLDFHTKSTEHNLISVTLENNGIGPARFISLEVSYNGKTIKIKRDSDYKKLLQNLGIPREIPKHALVVAEGTIIPPKEKMVLFELDMQSPEAEEMMKGQTLFDMFSPASNQTKHPKFKVKFQSLYDENFENEFDLNSVKG